MAVHAQRSQRFDLLDGGADGAKNNCEIQSKRLAPFVLSFITDHGELLFGHFWDCLEMFRVTRDEGTLLQVGKDVDEVMLVCKLFDITDNLRRSQVCQRIFDPTPEIGQ